ncbi:MAG: NAD-dependent epimerase/dehydratase family protein [Oscillospiraceae bacterium]|jgi:nucleoside-diphosphate-sugar epimerase|nr:NAD-dependent epimerase/dehydratase family protein [Oscillospiraceae bacterium]
MDFNNKTVLVSGANGFLPSALIFRLLQSGANIIALCRNRQRAEERFQAVIDNSKFKMIIQDVCEPVNLTSTIDYAIHGASPAGKESRHEYPVDTFNANLIGCKNLLELKPKRFMLISSVDVYGQIINKERFSEEDNGYLDLLNVRNAYSLGKRAAETLTVLYSAQYNIETVIARPFQVYGEGMVIGDGRLHGDFIQQIRNNNKIVLKSDGSAKRSFMYIDDCIEGLLTVLQKGENKNSYNVVDEKSEATVFELAKLYADCLNIPIEFDYEQRNSIEVTEALPCVLGSSEKLRSLGWQAKINLKDGVKKTINSFLPERECYVS